MKVICASNENSLISISNDGKFCQWSLENLNAPLEIYEIGVNERTIKNINPTYISPTCLDIRTKKEFEKIIDESNYLATNIEDLETKVGIMGNENGSIHSIKQNNNK